MAFLTVYLFKKFNKLIRAVTGKLPETGGRKATGLNSASKGAG